MATVGEAQIRAGLDLARDLRIIDEQANHAAAQLGAASADMDVVRQQFLRTAGPMLETTNLRQEWHGAPSGYERFLARIGMDPAKPPHINGYYNESLTNQVAAVITDLHTPDMLVALRIPNPSNRGAEYVIGRVTETRPLIDDGRLVLEVQTGTVNGRPARSVVPIGEIAVQFHESGDSVETTTVQLGAETIQPEVEYAYDDSRIDSTSARILGALARSGVKLSELGFAPERIQEERRHALMRLGAVLRGTLTYNNDVLKLVPTYETNAEALAAVNQLLVEEGTDRKLAEWVAFDIEMLRRYQ